MSLPDDPLICGVDVSGGGAAWNVIAFRRGGDARSIPRVRIPGEHTRDRSVLVGKLAEILKDQRRTRKVSAMFIDMAFGSASRRSRDVLRALDPEMLDIGCLTPFTASGMLRAERTRLMLLKRLAAVTLLPLLWAAPATAGSILVGVAWTGDGGSGPLYRIDPVTGATTPLGVSAFPNQLTGGPQLNQLIMMSPANPYTLDLSGQTIDMGSYSNYGLAVAYDTDRRTMWSVAFGQLVYLPADPCPHCVRSGTPVGSFGFDPYGANFAMDYAPGLGLYGIHQSTLFSIDRSTGHATALNPILSASGGPLLDIRDFAFDEYTGKLIVLAAVGPPYPSPPTPGGPHGIYSVDISTGQATLLTDQGPLLNGIASVEIPEPGPMALVGVGLLLLRRVKASRPR
jgi:hypothetical protein